MVKQKKIFLNLGSRLSLVFFGKLLTFTTVPIITRALGPENYGLYNLAITISTYAVLLANWGFLAKGIREVSKKQGNDETIVNRFISSKIVLGLFGWLITLIVCYIIYGSSKFMFVIFVAILGNVNVLLYIDFYYYGIKNAFLPSFSNFVGQVFFIILVLLFIKGEGDLLLLIFFYLSYYIVDTTILLFYYLRTHSIKISLSIKESFAFFKENFSLGLGSKSSFFQSSFPLLIIPVFLNDYSLGIFSAAFKFFLVISLILQAFNLVFSPLIVQARAKTIEAQKKLLVRLFASYLGIGIFCSITILLTSKYITPLLFGVKFNEAKPLIDLIAILLIPIWPLYSLLVSYMNNYEEDKIFLKGSLFQVIVIVVLVPLLIKIFSLEGVIFSLSISTIAAIIVLGSGLKSVFTKNRASIV